MWFDRSLFAGLLLVAAWGVQSAACGGAVVFDGPWPDAGGTGGGEVLGVSGAGGSSASGVGASSTGGFVGAGGAGTSGAGGGLGVGGGNCSEESCAGTGDACQCTGTCSGVGEV